MAIIDREDYEAIQETAATLVSSGDIDTYCQLAAMYHTTFEEIAAIMEDRPIPDRPMGPLPVVATYVER